MVGREKVCRREVAAAACVSHACAYAFAGDLIHSKVAQHTRRQGECAEKIAITCTRKQSTTFDKKSGRASK